MRINRHRTALLVLAFALLVLGGCGGGNSGPVTPATSDVQPTSAEPEAGAEPTLSEEGP